MKMQDSGRNLRSQKLAIIPPIMAIAPRGLETLVLKISEIKRTEFLLKLEHSQA